MTDKSGFLSISIFAASASVSLAAAPQWIEDSDSAFIRVHRQSAVEWLPWGSEAIERAAAEGKPVYLHIGYFTSELSRAMAEQTFSNPDTARTFNENFINVLVDAVEHPAVADLHQAYIREEKQLSGWPVNVWLTPEMKPIEGAAYLPPTEEWGQPGIINVMDRTLAAWRADPEGLKARATQTAGQLDGGVHALSREPVGEDGLKRILDMGIESWGYGYDAEKQVLGEPPQSLNPELIRALMASPDGRQMAVAILGAMIDSGVHDPLGGGFFRQAIGEDWRYPYFQKTLTDQAGMVHALLDAAEATGDERFRKAATLTLDFVLRELGNPKAGFVAAIDATSSAQMAAHFWTTRELNRELGRRDGASFAAAHGFEESGNVAPDIYLGMDTAGQNLPMRAIAAGDGFAQSRTKLMEARAKRAAPAKASIASTGTHGWLLGAFARAGKELNNERFKTAASQTHAFLRTELASDGSLRRLKGSSTAASPHDLALVASGLLQHHAATGDETAKDWAAKLQAELDEHYLDAEAGRYFASRGNEPGIWARVHVPPPGRGDVPSTEALAAQNLIHLGDRDKASSLLQSIVITIEESYDPANGGDLLALQRFLAE